ncbi:MAG TPA: TAXI family TRAP transporter solute-binding subunit [Alphaproteobacteria bacterium]|nr:TAXI family TRAP transporter solute-binding subunit [Alphaproteobacteria bacterium]
MKTIEAPKIDRQIEVHLMGDWGWANLHRVCGWLGSQLMEFSAKGSKYAIWHTPYAAAETVFSVSNGDVDMAMSTPAHMVQNALDGIGLYEGRQCDNLMSLGTMPQTDSLLFAVDAELGIRSFDDIREKKPALHISTAPNDGDNNIGFVVEKLLEVAEIPKEKIFEWGGSFVLANPPDQCALAVREGRANVLFYEAIMTPYWRNLARDKPLSFLRYDDEVLKQLNDTYNWQTNIVPAGYHVGQDQEIEAIDWSDWLMMVRPEFDDDVAYLMAWAGCNTMEIIERQYRHLDPAISPLTYPLDPAKICQSAIRLHPGAARYYRDAGLID